MEATAAERPPLHLDLGTRLAIAGFWTVFGLLESTNRYLALRSRGIAESYLHAMVGNMPWWWGWALLTPAVFLMARRVRFDRGRRAPAAVAHLAAALALSLVHMTVVGALYYRTHGAGVPSAAEQIRRITTEYLPLEVLTYCAVVGGYLALEFYRRYREGELATARLALRAAQLEGQMTEARLNALRMELNPHFLFNSLNAIAGLVRRQESAAAVRMLASLGDLLRQTLAGDRRHEVPLEEELALLEHYLRIEQVRFGDRLRVELDVADEARRAAVPPFLLQPLVENALRHGIAREPGPGRVVVRARRAGARLELEVRDTGRGFREVLREGVGLANTRARLAQLYGERGALLLGNGSGAGGLVVVTLPFQPLAESADAVAR